MTAIGRLFLIDTEENGKMPMCIKPGGKDAKIPGSTTLIYGQPPSGLLILKMILENCQEAVTRNEELTRSHHG